MGHQLERNLISRRLRNFKFPKFTTGYALSIMFTWHGTTRTFRGLCISIHNKNFKNNNSTFRLRNIFSGSSVEQSFPIYGISVRKIKLQRYERKKLFYKKSRLFYLRNKLNKESSIKPALF